MIRAQYNRDACFPSIRYKTFPFIMYSKFALPKYFDYWPGSKMCNTSMYHCCTCKS